MGHFLFEAEGCEVNLYCRDQATFERLVEVSENNSSLALVRDEKERPADPARLHLYLKGARIYAVNLEGSAHRGKTLHLPVAVAQAVASTLPFLKVPKNRRVGSAPFGSGMLPALTDF